MIKDQGNDIFTFNKQCFGVIIKDIDKIMVSKTYLSEKVQSGTGTSFISEENLQIYAGHMFLCLKQFILNKDNSFLWHHVASCFINQYWWKVILKTLRAQIYNDKITNMLSN